MEDKGLLELAAKAAGIEGEYIDAVYGVGISQPTITRPMSEVYGSTSHGQYDNHTHIQIVRPWNPLTDDGDALRLAVKLGIQITPVTKKEFSHKDCVYGSPHTVTTNGAGLAPGSIIADHSDDADAATRRAITRAAAEQI